MGKKDKLEGKPTSKMRIAVKKPMKVPKDSSKHYQKS